MAQTFEAFAEFDKTSEVRKPRNLAANNVAGTVSRNKSLPGARRKVLHRQRETLAVFVNAGDDRFNFLIFLKDIFRMLDLFGPRNIRDVNKSVNSLLEFHKRSEIGQIAN